jgi:hypothetical protein
MSARYPAELKQKAINLVTLERKATALDLREFYASQRSG